MNKIDKKNAFSKLIKLVVKNTDQQEGLRPLGVTRTGRPRKTDHERALGQKSYRLKSYLSVCVDSGQIERAFNLLANQENVHVIHYNTILKGWARLGALSQIQRVQQLMFQKEIQPNWETYSLLLLAHAKTAKPSMVATRELIGQMELKFDIRRIFQSTYLNEEERSLVRSLIKLIKPDFEDTYLNLSGKYKCKLLDNLDKQPIVRYDLGPPHNPNELLTLAEQQRGVEQKASVFVRSVAKSKIPKEALLKYNQVWLKHIKIWRETLTDALEKDLKELKEVTDQVNKIHLYPYLCSVKRETLVDLMLDEIEKNSFLLNYSSSTTILHRDLGTRVMNQYFADKEQADGANIEKKQIYSDYVTQYYVNPDLAGRLNSRQFFHHRAVETKNYAIYRDHFDRIPEWPRPIAASVGKFLYGIILREVKFDPIAAGNPKRKIKQENMVDAFYTAYCQVPNTYKIKEEFRTHRDFERLQRKCSSIRLRFNYAQLPCSSPPMPWLSHSTGGYLTTSSSLVRVPPVADQNPLRNSDPQKLYPSLDSLNSLGSCPWIVNQDILDIVINLFRSGGNPDLKVPFDEYKMNLTAPQKPSKDASQADKIMYRREHRSFEKKRNEMYSLWSDCLYRLSIANYFRDKVFWFPHNIDFRGRTYPIPPHFNHLGSDLPRSLLLFAKGQPLGESGLDWLKLHLINLGGSMKKSSIKERLEYANSILHSDILDSADNPWDGKRWWLKHDNPWQVLACCKEIAKAIRSRNVKEYVSHLPVHQDGSCNGLQHYAALGRDKQGGLAVNLIPSEKPHDVYSHVVDIVEKLREEDAQKGDPTALMLEGLVQRKVIKQTVMTTVYGVTRYGAHQQIARQLQAKGFKEDQIWKAARYLTTKTFDSIGKMFSSSTKIQAWLNLCAKTVASRFNQPVDWETPLGLPVVQPYMRDENPSLTIPTLASFELIDQHKQQKSQEHQPQKNFKLNQLKHRTAFPPNYIHSLDSSHMMLTSLYCQRAGLTFVSVHDCFWTHASSVEEMNRICREQFIALHSEPLLQDLARHFIKRYGKSSSGSLEIGIDLGSPSVEKTVCSDAPAESNPSTSQKLQVGRPKTLAQGLRHAKAKAAEDQRLIFSEVPEPGDLDLNVVRDSVYFFS